MENENNNKKPVSCMYNFPESGVCTTVSRWPLSVTRLVDPLPVGTLLIDAKEEKKKNKSIYGSPHFFSFLSSFFFILLFCCLLMIVVLLAYIMSSHFLGRGVF